MIQDKRPQSTINTDSIPASDNPEAGCMFALITGKRPVSRRNRALWYLNQLNKVVKCDEEIEEDETPNYSKSDTESTPVEPDINKNDQLHSALKNGDVSGGERENSPKLEPQTDDKDIRLVSITRHSHTTAASSSVNYTPGEDHSKPKSKKVDCDQQSKCDQHYLVTPNTRVLFLSRSIATSIILDLSPSVVSVSSQDGCVFLDSMFDALKRVLHLLVKSHEIPTHSALVNSKPVVLSQKTFISVIAYTPFVVAKNNQVLVQNRRVSALNIDQVLVEIWICLNRLTQEIHELVVGTCGMNIDFDTCNRTVGNVFVFPQAISGGIIRHPGSVLEDIYELGLFSSSLMPRLSRLSMIIISDGLFASTNNLNIFRLKSIAVSFISLGAEAAYPDSCFGYTPYIDLMRFTARTTLGVYLSHQDLIDSSQDLTNFKQIPLLNNPLLKLFCWTIHSEQISDQLCSSPKAADIRRLDSNINPIEMNPGQIANFFCIDQPVGANRYEKVNGDLNNSSFNSSCHNYHDWRSFRQLDRNLDADFEQVLSCLLREGYLIKSIQFKHKETLRIVARLVLHWRYNLDLEQELTASYWSHTDPFDLSDSSQLILRPFNTPLYGDTYCEIIVHGSYSFLHNLYCDRRPKRRTEYRDIAYRQFRQLIDGVLQTHEQLQYLSRFYRDSSLSKVPSYLLHGNSLLYEQPHTHRLTSTIENVRDETKTSEFQEYWQKISCLDTRSWKNLMHIHTVRLVLEHDQPKHKNIHCQSSNGRYTHVQCRRALSAISTFIKSYSSFALLEDTTYIKFIYNKDDDLREIETSATKGFIVIRINKLLPILVIYLMFTSGILDSHRVQIVSYLEKQLTKCKLRNVRTSNSHTDNLLKSKTILPSSESSCVLIKSPLERMLKVYSRNFINEYLIHNWSHGLPGSCPYNNMQQSYKYAPESSSMMNHLKGSSSTKVPSEQNKDQNEAHGSDHSIHRYNLVFGKYLYGVRVVQTISNLPHDIVPSLAANVLSRISALLVNFRIKQGFHIAFNNSGILNLVVELLMQDQSNEKHSSSCLCQYIVFPPTIANCSNNSAQTANSTVLSNGQVCPNTGSRPNSLTGSLTNSDSFLRNSAGIGNVNLQAESNPHMKADNGEIRVIKEYWIEQQYGTSAESESCHYSLENLRYSEIVDHLFVSDMSIFDCLLTYDLLQLLCDKLSPYYELDKSINKNEIKRSSPLFSPTSPTISSNLDNGSYGIGLSASTGFDESDVNGKTQTILPSTLIEGTSKDSSCKVPLVELEYKFSVMKFLDYCQQASLNVLLFKNQSEFYDPTLEECDRLDPECQRQMKKMNSDLEQATALHSTKSNLNVSELNKNQQHHFLHQQQHYPHPQATRKLSIDPSEFDSEHLPPKREHRSSYQHDNLSVINSYVSTIYSPSLNHLFLETLHKRLKQMHDKELKLSEFDRASLPGYLKKRKLIGDEMEAELLASGLVQDESQNDSTGKMSYNPSSMIRKIATKLDMNEEEWTSSSNQNNTDNSKSSQKSNEPSASQEGDSLADDSPIDWRCYLRKGNQDNLLIVLVPSTLEDVSKWLNYSSTDLTQAKKHDPVCPIFVFRCSSSMINECILSYLKGRDETTTTSISASSFKLPTPRTALEADLSLHFGQPCSYMGRLRLLNDELKNETLPYIRYNLVNAVAPDEKTLEAVHFKAFLRKIKNTVLKSRFSSLNDAYLSELFVHKNDILYYINYVDIATQKKYHVSAQLRSLADFIKNYDEYSEALPEKPRKVCNKLLNSILLQKCGLFINQPIARFNEANPLIKQLNDRKLLFLMRCNYKIELPILEESLISSTLLKNFVKPSSVGAHHHPHYYHHRQQQQQQQQQHQQLHNLSMNNNSPTSNTSAFLASTSGTTISGSIGTSTNVASFSLGKASGLEMGQTPGSGGPRLAEMKYGSAGGTSLGSPNSPFNSDRLRLAQQYQNHHFSQTTATPRLGSSSTLNTLSSLLSDSFILEAFRGSKSCSIEEVPIAIFKDDISLRHEAHMAEVLRRTGERKESHHYRRVLKSKSNYNQSHTAIDQALKRVDSLGRLEHFCLTPLLFSPAWRTKLAPVRDHTIESIVKSASESYDSNAPAGRFFTKLNSSTMHEGSSPVGDDGAESDGDEQAQEVSDDLWHQTVCNNYIKEYEQYIQTLGFNSVQIRYQSSAKASGSSVNPSTIVSCEQQYQPPPSTLSQSTMTAQSPSTTTTTTTTATPKVASSNSSSATKRSKRNSVRHTNSNSPSYSNSLSKHSTGQASISTSAASLVTATNQSAASASSLTTTNTATTTNTCNTGYLIKFLNSGCLVFKVGFCKPYVYSILYSIEGERFNNSNMKLNMTAFLDELDSIKVTMHLHSFTYDYHLRSMYSYISGRQLTFSPGYHLISFLDDFRKYYQKAPNYARNHILSGEICVRDLKICGTQLYAYIANQNDTYNMEVLEMTSPIRDILSQRLARKLALESDVGSIGDQRVKGLAKKSNSNDQANEDECPCITSKTLVTSHVLIELKREKVRYRDGKDPDIFECGLLIAHDYNQQQIEDESSRSKFCLTLKYFLILTNQRDLYPKLIHTYDNIISLGCHRPIRLNVAQRQARAATPSSSNIPSASARQQNQETTVDNSCSLLEPSTSQLKAPSSITGASSAGQSDVDDFQLSELQSSGEVSGHASINSTANSVQSSNSGLQFGPNPISSQKLANEKVVAGTQSVADKTVASVVGEIPKIKIVESSDEIATATTRISSLESSLNMDQTLTSANHLAGPGEQRDILQMLATSSVEEGSFHAGQFSSSSPPTSNGSSKRKRITSTGSSNANDTTGTGANAATKSKPPQAPQERTICDEEITYLGYFSSDEMDMLKFLQEKTNNLRAHIDCIVRQAEANLRRDILWDKLMRVRPEKCKTDELSMSTEELFQLLSIVEALDLSSMDSQLSVFTSMHISWHLKLLQAFTDVKHLGAGSDQQNHRIHIVNGSKLLLLYIDNKCDSAFILLSIDTERQSVELNLLIKDKKNFCKTTTTTSTTTTTTTTEAKSPANQEMNNKGNVTTTTSIELDQDCRRLIRDFINFCATFMWSTFLP